jgi:hypothetical protein
LRKEKGKLKRQAAYATILTLLVGSMLLFAVYYVKADANMPDLQVGLTSIPSVISGTYNHMSNGSSPLLVANVTNVGNASASSVGLYLYINGTLYSYQFWPTLAANSSQSMSYAWSSPAINDYYLAVYAPPVAGETNTANNNFTAFVRVCPDTKPVASFTVTFSPLKPPGPVENSSTVIFDGSSSYDPDRAGPPTLTYTWSFGDNTTPQPSTNGTITHVYKTWSNNYIATLQVRNGENLLNSTSLPVFVYGYPIVNFEVDAPPSWKPGQDYVNEQLIFNATGSYDPDNQTTSSRGIVNFNWTFGDGNITSTSGPITVHTYTSVSVNPVVLNVTDCDGLSNSYSFNINVTNPAPVAVFEPPGPPTFEGYNLTFNASASYDPKNWTAQNPSIGIATYHWDFGDNSTATVSTNVTTHQYLSVGIFNVNLSVTDSTGLNSSMVKTLVVTQEVFLSVVNEATGSTTIIYNPGEKFNVTVTVTNVTDLYSYDLNLTWPGTNVYPIFDNVSVVGYGGFLSQGANENFNISSGPFSDSGYVRVNSTRTGSSNGVSGSGALFTLTFHVNDTMTGNCSILISSDLLQNSSRIGSITATLMNGNFITTLPVASFTFSPQVPTVNSSTVIFDASASYDPENTTAPHNGIFSYTWDFNDSSSPVTVYIPIKPYMFQNIGYHNVNLTVTDYTNETWSVNYTVFVRSSVDVDVLAIAPSNLQFNGTVYETTGYLNLSVTVKNEANAPENFNITVYFNDTIAYVNNTNYFTVTVDANNSPVVNFNCKIWDATTNPVPTGLYNITVITGRLSDEPPNSDNNMTYTVGVEVYVPGDINHDGTSNVLDGIIMSYHFGHIAGPSGWTDPLDRASDLNGDGVINILDAIILSNNFLRHKQ